MALSAAQAASCSSAHSLRRHSAPLQRAQRSAGEPHWAHSIEIGMADSTIGLPESGT
jgi:hypothetical protein